MTLVTKIYSHTGTFGTNGVPIGTALATSDSISASTLTTTANLKTFNFTGANNITLNNTTKYVAVVESCVGNDTNYVQLGSDISSPSEHSNVSYFYNAN